jgi:hypothetical protein
MGGRDETNDAESKSNLTTLNCNSAPALAPENLAKKICKWVQIVSDFGANEVRK